MLDTHAWFWWEVFPHQLSTPAAAVIEQADHIAISAVSCWELTMLATRSRIELDRPAEHWIQHSLSREKVQALDLTPAAAIAAALLPRDGFPADPADRLIYASSRLAGAQLVTRDQRLRRYDPAMTVW